MKNIKDFIDECGAAPAGGFGAGMATPGNTMGMMNPAPPGMGDPSAIGSEGVPTAKSKQEKRKRKKPKAEEVTEAMKFNIKGFAGELALLMMKYKVRFIHDVEGAYFEDESGEMVLDLTDKFITPEKMSKIAVKIK